jgi:hypothetical protein
MGLNALETEMANFDFEGLSAQNESAKASIASAASVDDIKAAICGVWSKIGKYVKMAEVIPVVGKFITILADLLDSICAG